MSEFLSYGFIQRALITGVLLAIPCAVLAFFVVLRRMAFIGVGISHAALGGVALGVVLGVSPVLAAALFSVGVAWVIGWISGRGQISEDTAIGVFFPTAMALGVALISFSPTYRQDLMGYLFGNILSVRALDVWLLGALAAFSLLLLTCLFKELLFWGVDGHYWVLDLVTGDSVNITKDVPTSFVASKKSDVSAKSLGSMKLRWSARP